MAAKKKPMATPTRGSTEVSSVVARAMQRWQAAAREVSEAEAAMAAAKVAANEARNRCEDAERAEHEATAILKEALAKHL